MKTLRLNLTVVFSALILGGIPALGQSSNEPTSVELPIRDVQLFSDQALVLRSGRVSLGPGQNTIIVTDLPQGLRTDSVRVQLEASQLKLREIKVETTHAPRYNSEQARKAEADLREAEAKLRSLTDRYNVLKGEANRLASIALGAEQDQNDETTQRIVDPVGWERSLDFVQTSLADNHRAQELLLDDIDLAREELSVALFVAERYRSGRSLSKKRVRITVDNRSGVVVPEDLRIHYRIGDASWYPVYQARVSHRDDKPTLRLVASALTRNETGEDWENVRLRFSAADPEESGRLPLLSEWHIRSQVTAVTNQPGSTSTGGARRSDTYADAVADEADDAEMTIVQEEESVVPARERERYAREEMQQRQIRDQTTSMRRYYEENTSSIPADRANRRSGATNTLLNNARNQLQAQDRAFVARNYEEAWQNSQAALNDLMQVPERYRDRLSEELNAAREARRRALTMQESQGLIQRVVPPSRSSRGFDYNYEGRGRETINSDGVFRKVFLFEKDLDVSLAYESAPRAQPFAFLTGQVQYAEATPLLAGPVAVFHENDFVGQAQLPTVSRAEPFQLSLGANENIELTRRENRFRRITGLLAKTYNYDVTVNITVRNHESHAVTLDLFESVPVSVDEEIEISAISFSEQPTESRDNYGLHRFRLRLPPGSERTIKVSYTFAHSENALPVFRTGGDRPW